MENNIGYLDLITAAYEHTNGFRAIEESKFLSERQKHILLARYRDCKSYAAIGAELNLTGQRIQQITLNSMEAVRMTLLWACMTTAKREEYKKPTIEYEDMSARSRNALMRNRLTSAEKVIEFLQANSDMEPEAAFMKLRNVGRKSAHEMYRYYIKKKLYMPPLPKEDKQAEKRQPKVA